MSKKFVNKFFATVFNDMVKPRKLFILKMLFRIGDKMVKKIIIWGTSGPDDPEKAVLPFIIANAGFVHDAEVYVMLAGSGVWLAKKGVAEQ